MKRSVVICCLCILFIVFAGCRKSAIESHGPPPEVVDDVLRHRILLNKAVAEILEEVYIDERAVNEVNAAILSGYYEDERVLLKDLLLPAQSGVYHSKAFQMFEVDTGIFRRRFCEIILRNDKRPALTLLTRPLPKWRGKSLSMTVPSEARIPLADGALTANIDTSVALYFPYSQSFAAPRRITIVAADRDADSGMGRQQGSCRDVKCVRDVVVNDDYAANNPTHIITSGAKAKRVVRQTPGDEANRVFHGWSRLTRQMDKLISLTGNGGGSEIKIARIEGYLKRSDQQVQEFSGDVVTVYYSRGDIRKKKWKRVYSIWDANWKADNEEQVYAVYEEDTQGEKTFSGTLTTTVNIPGKPSPGKTVGEIGFKITVLTQDEILTQRRLDRTSYLRTALVNQGWGFYDDMNQNGKAESWPIYDGAAVWQYTLPVRLQ